MWFTPLLPAAAAGGGAPASPAEAPDGWFDPELVAEAWFDALVAPPFGAGWFYKIEVENAAPGAGVVVYAWDGAAWAPSVVRVWDGAAWVAATLRVWNGAAWV